MFVVTDLPEPWVPGHCHILARHAAPAGIILLVEAPTGEAQELVDEARHQFLGASAFTAQTEAEAFALARAETTDDWPATGPG